MLQTGNRDGGDQYKPRAFYVFRVEFKQPKYVTYVDDCFNFSSLCKLFVLIEVQVLSELVIFSVYTLIGQE